MQPDVVCGLKELHPKTGKSFIAGGQECPPSCTDYTSTGDARWLAPRRLIELFAKLSEGRLQRSELGFQLVDAGF